MVLLGFSAAALVVIALVMITNVLLFPRLRAAKASKELHGVSVIIPARNEEDRLGVTLTSLVSQTTADVEIIVLDDHSTDRTAEIARAFAPRVKTISGTPLPLGWTGKNWACQQLADAARGDVLVFTDADVLWTDGGLAAAAAEFRRTRADLLSIWPTQITMSWAERLVVPLIALVIFGYLPVLAVHRVPIAAFAAANGQCMLWRRTAYDRVGGHRTIRGSVLDDVLLARQVKRAGLRLRNADGAGWISCRMYEDWGSVRRGFAKNILAGFGGPIPLIGSIAFHWIVFWWPWLWLFSGGDVTASLAVIGAGIAVRLVSAAATRQRTLDALLMPLSVGLMTVISFQALYWHFARGGPEWKGRKVAA
ncbi:MAG: glycosyltransferase [Chloroflexi bacterium]|nr:glycosyltransferase [Chloroflexota bacterium]